MKNFICHDDSIQLIAPAGGVVGGQVFKQGYFIGMVFADALESEQFTLMLEGVFGNLPKKAADVFTTGDILYWDNANKYLTNAANGTVFAGYAAADAAGVDTTCTLMLRQATTPAA